MELYYKNMNLESLEGEIWLPVKDFEIYYEVSNLGRVKSLGRVHEVGRWGGIRVREAKILIQTKNKYGYLIVSLTKNGKIKSSKVARLVCAAFNENKEDKRTVNHISGNKLDNRKVNLEWATDSEQQIHRRDVLKMNGNWHNKKRPPFSEEWKKRISEGKKGCKGTRGKLVLDLSNGVFYESAREVAQLYKINESGFKAMLNGQNKNKTKFIYA